MLRFLVVVCCSLAFFRPAISTAISTEALEPVAARGFEQLELLPSALLDRRCGWSVGRNTGKFSWVPRPALRTVSGHARFKAFWAIDTLQFGQVADHRRW